MRKNRARGFTLIEIMVAAAVSMLLLAGAFEMHSAFNRQSIRQQEVADMQQALRVAAQLIGRSVRDAGTGLFGGTAQVYNAGVGPQPCTWPGAPPVGITNGLDLRESCLWPVQYSNSNGYANPKTAYDTNPSDLDTDEDWLRIISFDGTTAVREDVSNGADNPSASVFAVTDIRNFTVLGFFYVGNTYPSFLDASGHPTFGWRTGCIRQVTAISGVPNPSGPPTPGTITFSPNPYNPSLPDLCIQSASVKVTPPSTSLPKGQVTYIYPVDRSVVFRIQPAVAGGAGVPTVPPQLQAWYSVPGNTPSWMANVAPPWQTLAENIEHMQIALVLNDGSVCGNLINSVDSPALCNFQNVRAVRLTLVARSSSSWFGWLSQGVGAGSWEDFPWPLANDGYLRRTLTTEIAVRNDPWGKQ